MYVQTCVLLYFYFQTEEFSKNSLSRVTNVLNNICNGFIHCSLFTAFQSGKFYAIKRLIFQQNSIEDPCLTLLLPTNLPK